jgi:amidohydrolase
MDREELRKKLIPWFEWFHRNPELSYREYETTGRIRGILTEAGIEITDTGLETGLVARIGKGKPVTALRADIDALPVTEESGLPYASEIPGRMHACGHDFHATALLGAALLLKEKQEELHGTVKLFFQPAEESGRGAAKIIETGELEDVEENYGLHVSPDLPPA